MTGRWLWVLRQFGRRLWVRASLFCLLGVGTALLALLAHDWIPGWLPTRIGADAVDRILGILASSLLAVTTFSLSVMVSAYSAATSSVTPRATKLLLEDSTTQNALGTFIGSFLFSLVGLVALSTGAYGEGGRLVLFAATVVVIVLIVVTLLRWIEHLSRLGRVGETTARIEEVTAKALAERARASALDAAVWSGRQQERPPGTRAVFPRRVGYVQHVDLSSLDACFSGRGVEAWLCAVPGGFVAPTRPLAWLRGPAFDDEAGQLCKAFSISDERSFDQDPRFGLCVLAEIAQRALSPGINDPGTAIDVIGRGVRLLANFAEARKAAAERPLRYASLRIPQLVEDDLFDDLFVPIARDGAHLFEVQLRLRKGLADLAALDDPALSRAAARCAAAALERGLQGVGSAGQRRRLQEVVVGD